jgi:hypothetical protein
MESVVFRNQFHKWKTTCDQLNFHLRKHRTETKHDEKRKSEYQKILQDEQQNSLSQQWRTNSEGSWTSTDYKLLIKITDQIWEKERPSPHHEVLHRGKIGATPTDSVIRFFRSPQAPGAQSERSYRASRRSTAERHSTRRRKLRHSWPPHETACVLGIVFLSIPCFFYKRVHAVVNCVLICAAAWNGAQRYSFYLLESYAQIVRKELEGYEKNEWRSP